jgi:hypothetical protein
MEIKMNFSLKRNDHSDPALSEIADRIAISELRTAKNNRLSFKAGGEPQ